jgi:hypothetical protein
MEIRGIQHVWVPDGEYICVRVSTWAYSEGLTDDVVQLYYANSANSQRLGRVCLTRDAVRIELGQHAMEARLAEVCILSASIFLSGFKID